jgi:hypothetical protein
MPEEEIRKLRHFILQGFSEKEKYSRPKNKVDLPIVPEQNRTVHGNYLLAQIKSINRDMLSAIEIQKRSGVEADRGIQIEFESFPDIGRAFESLSFRQRAIKLENVRQLGNQYFATVFIPEGKLLIFEKMIHDYQSHKVGKAGQALDYRQKIDTIKEIRVASLRALWTDDTSCFPSKTEPAFWWEAWLPLHGNRAKTVVGFRTMASKLGLETSRNEMSFPERTIVLIKADRKQMEEAIIILNTVAELRRAKETAEFFTELTPYEEKAWVADLLQRLDYVAATEDVPRICILDTGINRGHPLLESSLDSDDLYSVDPSWGLSDQEGHGTALAGLALFGDLAEPLASSDSVYLSHRLESSKLLSKDGSNTGDEHLHANLTVQAVSRPEISFPERKRVFELAISADDYRDRGRPSAWSAAIDQLAAGAETDGNSPRLFVVAAGNIDDIHEWERYPASNEEQGIHDPGQSWNALTVGAYTNKIDIRGEGTQNYKPIAPAGDISPFSTTSVYWDKQWPSKPDVVTEGGNVARDILGAACMDSLSLLSTNYIPSNRLLRAVNATSASSALVAKMAAQIMAQYPELRPETVRGIIIHSAEWTDAMLSHYGINEDSQKDAYANLIRHCGFGVPSLEKALWSLSNSVTMIIEDSITPFSKEASASPHMNEMKYYSLPWPEEILRNMGEEQVEMRVTLSYYIEPNPSSRGRSKYCYESHGLRFDVKQPAETIDHFMGRKNQQRREEGLTYKGTYDSSKMWKIGEKLRHHGSIHSDIWRGSAADLASCGFIAVYPTGGWWQKRPDLKKFASSARYSLIASIQSSVTGVDLYTSIENLIAAKIAPAIVIS